MSNTDFNGKPCKKPLDLNKIKKSDKKVSHKAGITYAHSVPRGGAPLHSSVAPLSVPPPSVLSEDPGIFFLCLL